MNHQAKVARLAKAVAQSWPTPGGLVLAKASVSHVVPGAHEPRANAKPLDLKSLNEILLIDADKQIAVAEAGVSFYDLVQATLPLGLMPAVVPELKTITVGGAVSGCSVEALSYKYGGFHDSCLAYELVNGRGEIINCSRQVNPDIFEMIHGSYGTLGILTKITCKLLPAKPLVKMTYLKFSDFADFWDNLQELCAGSTDNFIDAIIHAPNKFTICLGQFVDKAPYLSHYDWLKVFYKSTWQKTEDYLTTSDYFFRYDADCHWLSKTVPGLENKLVRALIGKFVLGSTNLINWSRRLKKLLAALKRRPDIIVDVFIPQNNFPKFYRWYAKDFNFFPLWIVPYRPRLAYPWLNETITKAAAGQLFIDCAIYGRPNNNPGIDWSKVLEDKVFALGGIKTLISQNHYSPERFWQIYNRQNYNAIKNRLDKNNKFGDLYQKMCQK